MSTTTRRMTKARTALVGMFLLASTMTLAGPATAAPGTPDVAPVIETVVDREAADLKAAIAAIPTETLPVTAALRSRLETKIVSRAARRGTKGKAQRPAHSSGARALAAARTNTGDAYSYGAVGPNAFDCSGLTMWAYARVGESLPHSSDAQVGRTTRVARPGIGDLVFFHSGGNVYHVGLYAGGGTVFHASRPGTPVGTAKIWTSSVFFGRVR